MKKNIKRIITILLLMLLSISPIFAEDEDFPRINSYLNAYQSINSSN